MVILEGKYKVMKVKVKDPDAPRYVNKDFSIVGEVSLSQGSPMLVSGERIFDTLMTSPVLNMEDTKTGYIVETKNSVYILERIEFPNFDSNDEIPF